MKRSICMTFGILITLGLGVLVGTRSRAHQQPARRRHRKATRLSHSVHRSKHYGRDSGHRRPMLNRRA